MFAEAFAEIAAAVSAEFEGPFYAAKLRWPGEATFDEGGSIATPGTPEEHDCMAQIDRVTEEMRSEAGFTDKDVRLIVIATDLQRSVDTSATVEVLEGPHVGTWSVQSQALDTVGCAYDGRGRKA